MSVKNLLVLASIIAAAVIIFVEGMDNYEKHFVLRPDKDPRCDYFPSSDTCRPAMFPIPNFTLTGWFFHVPFKSCRPVYINLDRYPSCFALLKDVPKTKEACEDLCGEPCQMKNGSIGLCMYEDYCDHGMPAPAYRPLPCGAYNVKCCTRDYKSDVALVVRTEFLIDKFPRPMVEYVPEPSNDTYVHYKHPERYNYGPKGTR